MKYKRNLFISFEGPEASGKSSQLRLLSKYFLLNNIPHLITREPGGTLNAEKLRKIILNKKESITPTEEVLLLMAARLNHINKVIKPALKAGKIVISDRFADSTFVYQGFVNNYGMKKTISLHKVFLNNFLPQKTFLLLLSPQKINKRLQSRKISNKYDKTNSSFHAKVIKGYKKLSNNNKRFFILKGDAPINHIHEKIIKELNI